MLPTPHNTPVGEYSRSSHSATSAVGGAGGTRGWGKFDRPIAYENISATAEIIEWRDIDKEDREGLGKAPLIKELEQGIIFARKLGQTKQRCAEEMGVHRSAMYRWLEGQDYPDEESEQKIKKWLLDLRDTLTMVSSNRARKEQVTSRSKQSEVIPAAKKDTPVKESKKAIPGGSGTAPQKFKDLTVKTLILNKDNSEKHRL